MTVSITMSPLDCFEKINQFEKRVQKFLVLSKNPRDGQIEILVSQAFILLQNLHYQEIPVKNIKEVIKAQKILSSSLEAVANKIVQIKEKKCPGLKERFLFYFSSPTKKPNYEKKLHEMLSFLKNARINLEPECIKIANKRINDIEQTIDLKIWESFFRVIDRIEVDNKQAGMKYPSCGMRSVKKDLELFKKTYFNDLSNEDKKKLDQILQNLNFAAKLSNPIELWKMRKARNELLGNLDNDDLNLYKCPLENAMKEAISQIKLLSPGENIVIPGGHPGHSVLFQIKKEENNTYTFVIINTGDGAFQVQGTNPPQYCDGLVRNLALEDVTNHEFLVKLGMANSHAENMEATFQLILEHLQKGDVTKLVGGRVHGIQVNRTCTYSCIESWMESELDPALFSCIVQFMNLRGLRDLRELREKNKDAADVQKLEVTIVKDKINLKGVAVIDTFIKFGKQNAFALSQKFEKGLQVKSKVLIDYNKTDVKVNAIIKKYGFQSTSQATSIEMLENDLKSKKVTYYQLNNTATQLSKNKIEQLSEAQIEGPKISIIIKIFSWLGLIKLTPEQSAWTKYKKTLADYKFVSQHHKLGLELNHSIARAQKFAPIIKSCVAAAA